MSLFNTNFDSPQLNKNALVMFCAMDRALKLLRKEITITELELREFKATLDREGGPLRILSGTNMATMETIYRVRLRKQGEVLDMKGNLAPRRNRIITLE